MSYPKFPSPDWPWRYPVASAILQLEWMRQQEMRRAAWMAALMLLTLFVVVHQWNSNPVFAMFSTLIAVLFGVWAVLFFKIASNFKAMLADLRQLRRRFGDAPRGGIYIKRPSHPMPRDSGVPRIS